MKKLITILLVLIFNSINALNFTISNPSFDQLNEVCPGSIQHIDVGVSGGYSSSDHLKIYIHHKLIGGGTSNIEVIFDTIFYSYFFNLPLNSNGTRTIYFTLPEIYLAGDFYININLTPSHSDGVLCENSVGLKNIYPKISDKIIFMSDINGKEVVEKKGLIIILYESGRREKIYIESE